MNKYYTKIIHYDNVFSLQKQLEDTFKYNSDSIVKIIKCNKNIMIIFERN